MRFAITKKRPPSWRRTIWLRACWSAATRRLAMLRAPVGRPNARLRAPKRSFPWSPTNGSAMSYAVGALTALGEAERAKEWAERALLLDPDNLNLRYNLACTLVVDLHEVEAALDLLGPAFEKLRIEAVNWAKTDPDLDIIRDHPRFKAMLVAADARLMQS